MVGSTDPLHFDMPYGFAGPQRFDETESYAGVTAEESSGGNVNYAHSLGEVVSAAVRAGLRVDALHEHLDLDFDPRGNILTRDDDGRYRLRLGDQPLPLLFTLLAAKP
jgi:hypothetical protein